MKLQIIVEVETKSGEKIGVAGFETKAQAATYSSQMKQLYGNTVNVTEKKAAK